MNSIIQTSAVERVAAVPGVAEASGVLATTVRVNASHPQFVEIGLEPARLPAFGIQVTDGRTMAADAEDEIMLGSTASESLGKGVSDSVGIKGIRYRIVGVYTAGQPTVDAAAMLPLAALQSQEHKQGLVTMVFVRRTRDVSTAAVEARVRKIFPQFETVRYDSDLRRVDRSLGLVTIVDRAASLVALVVGAVVVASAMSLSFFERTSEFGMLRAVGWTRAASRRPRDGRGRAHRRAGRSRRVGVGVPRGGPDRARPEPLG